MKKLVILLMLLVNSPLLFAGGYVDGKDYKTVTPQATETGDKIEVLEFFWYGCPHCYSFEPYVQAWKKTKPANVEFVRIPAVFRPDWEIQARAYYALSNMGVIESVHEKIFRAIHKDKKRLNKMDDIASFVEKNGVDRKKFMQEVNSFAVDGMLRKGKKKQAAYKIQGVPTVIVNGKYMTSGSMSGSYENMIKIINYLLAKESK